MKQFLIYLLLISSISFAQTEKVTMALQKALEKSKTGVPAWVYFSDKGPNAESKLQNPASLVSERSLKRRAKVLDKNRLVDEKDLPVNAQYIAKIEKQGIRVRKVSKWFNAISVEIKAEQLGIVAGFGFVNKLDLVKTFAKRENSIEFTEAEEPKEKMVQEKGTHELSYGDSFTQLEQMNVPAVHDMGITGEGVLICMMDAGYNLLGHESFSHLNILATWDFVNGDADVSDGSDMGTGTHGTMTLSTIAGKKEGSHYGPAFNADFILAKTENTESETPVEEDNWIAAAEWADSIGADMTSTSLGYITFDSPYTDYTWQDMDGNTCLITIGADIAASKGIVIVNSAGNEGTDASHNTLGAPSDGDSVLCVGAVTSTGARSYFSSVGNTADGRTKPDVMAMGSSVHVASTSNTTGYTYADGTSFSCPLTAGVVGLMLSFNPNLTPVQVYDILRTTADNADNPNREYGWGIVNAYQAIMYSTEPDEVAPTTVADLAATSVMSNSISLAWNAPSDTSVGGVMGYDLRMSTSPINNDTDFENATQLSFEGSPAEPGNAESFMVDELTAGTTYYFAVKSKDFWDNWSDLSNVVESSTYQAPALSVNPESVSIDANVGDVVSETLTIENTTDFNSTLDYSIEMLNNNFPEESVEVKLVPKSAKAAEESKNAKSTTKGQHVKGFGGPDNFGYEWIDSNEDNGPSFVWNDISSTGTEVTNWTATGTYDPLDEGKAGPIDLGFSFKFYGETYNSVYVNSNGFISFNDITENQFTNDAIPSADTPNAIVALLWDDLDGEGGHFYYQQFGNTMVFQFSGWHEYSGDGTMDAQVVLSSSGQIMLYYNSLTLDLTSATVGIENAAGDDGLQIDYNGSYLSSQLAVKISAEPEWVVPDNMAGMLYNGNSVDVVLNFLTNDIPEGNYSIDLQITTNDPENETKVVPVTMQLGEAQGSTASMTMTGGWNLVAMPLQLSDMDASSVFPNASSAVYGYTGSYNAVSTLEMGDGYWVKYDSEENMNLNGTAVSGNVSLVSGWNLVGVNNETVEVSTLVTEPTGIVESEFFSFDGQYNIASTLEPGKGYWVKTSDAGTLNLSEKSAAKLVASNLSSDDNVKLSFVDAAGNTSSLYLVENTDGIKNVMPPLPPAGAFDVRFDGDTYVEEFDLNRVVTQGVQYPLVVRTNKEVMIQSPAFTNGSVILKSGESVTLTEGAGNMTVSAVVIPEVYGLDQNYPNPFNPSTTIKFSLPESAKVSLRVYSILGEEVQVLTNDVLEAGYHEVKFNATDLPSGVYFYNITAGNFSDTKKMLLIK